MTASQMDVGRLEVNLVNTCQTNLDDAYGQILQEKDKAYTSKSCIKDQRDAKMANYDFV